MSIIKNPFIYVINAEPLITSALFQWEVEIDIRPKTKSERHNYIHKNIFSSTNNSVLYCYIFPSFF